MRTQHLIFIFVFSLAASLLHAQGISASPRIWRQPHKPAVLFEERTITFNALGDGRTAPVAMINTAPPKLPFFCGMEDKFRSRFNVFLKLRAGNDDMYMHLIENRDH